MFRRRYPAANSSISMLGDYEDKYTECLKLLVEDCQEEMLHLFHQECGSCIIKEKCCREWVTMVCNHRDPIKPEEFVSIVRKFLQIKAEARIQFRYRKVLCLRLTTSS